MHDVGDIIIGNFFRTLVRFDCQPWRGIVGLLIREQSRLHAVKVAPPSQGRIILWTSEARKNQKDSHLPPTNSWMRNLDIKAREKVATVRKKGACLRCRALKTPVISPALRSVLHQQLTHGVLGSWPCTSCTDNKVSCHGRDSKCRWMDCVSYCLKAFDIYALGTLNPLSTFKHL